MFFPPRKDSTRFPPVTAGKVCSTANLQQYGHRETQNRGRKTGVSGAEKRKLVFRAFTPHGSKEKICLTYFEICQTYFKIQGTYFSPPENRFENRPGNADKTQTRAAGAGDQWPFGHKTVCYMFRKCGQKSRAAWRGRMWNVKRGIRAAVCSGSARDTRWTGVRPRARLRISRLCPTHVRSRGRRRL